MTKDDRVYGIVITSFIVVLLAIVIVAVFFTIPRQIREMQQLDSLGVELDSISSDIRALHEGRYGAEDSAHR